MEKQKRSYSKEFKIKAVELSNQRGYVKAVAEELGISADILRRWKIEYKIGKFDLLSKPISIKSKEELENINLRKALREAEMERDILKKALNIFSKSDR
jgi:transposase